MIELPASAIVRPVSLRMRPRLIVVPARSENGVPLRTIPSKFVFAPKLVVDPTCQNSPWFVTLFAARFAQTRRRRPPCQTYFRSEKLTPPCSAPARPASGCRSVAPSTQTNKSPAPTGCPRRRRPNPAGQINRSGHGRPTGRGPGEVGFFEGGHRPHRRTPRRDVGRTRTRRCSPPRDSR